MRQQQFAEIFFFFYRLLSENPIHSYGRELVARMCVRLVCIYVYVRMPAKFSGTTATTRIFASNWLFVPPFALVTLCPQIFVWHIVKPTTARGKSVAGSGSVLVKLIVAWRGWATATFTLPPLNAVSHSSYTLRDIDCCFASTLLAASINFNRLVAAVFMLLLVFCSFLFSPIFCYHNYASACDSRSRSNNNSHNNIINNSDCELNFSTVA